MEQNASKKQQSKKSGTKPSRLMKTATNKEKKRSPGSKVLLHFSLDENAVSRKVFLSWESISPAGLSEAAKTWLFAHV